MPGDGANELGGIMEHPGEKEKRPDEGRFLRYNGALQNKTIFTTARGLCAMLLKYRKETTRRAKQQNNLSPLCFLNDGLRSRHRPV